MKSGPAIDFLNQQLKSKPVKDYELESSIPPKGRMPIGRLGLYFSDSPSEITADEYANRIREQSLANHTFFVDAGFVSHRDCPDVIWEALLEKGVVIVREVWHELSAWSANPKVNKYFHKCVQSKDPRIHVADPKFEGISGLENTLKYYWTLLAFRKIAFDTAKAHLHDKGIQNPTLDQIRSESQKAVGNRGMTLASKGFSDKGKRNLFFDEALVVKTFLYAIRQGRESTILTCDKDIVDQFVRLQYLMDTHYRSFLIAEKYSKNPENFYEDFADLEQLHDGFEEVAMLKMPAGLEDKVVRGESDFVNVYVNRFERTSGFSFKVQSVIFSAETEMEGCLKVKNDAKGLNTNKLGGKNLHIKIQGFSDHLAPNSIFIGKEKSVEIDEVLYSAVDLDLAVLPSEQIVRKGVLSPRNQSDRERKRLRVAANVANFQIDSSVDITTWDDYQQIDTDVLGCILKMLPSWTNVIFDISFDESEVGLYRGLSGREEITAVPENRLTNDEFFRNENVDCSSQQIDFEKIVHYYLGVLAYRKTFVERTKKNWLQNYNNQMTENKLREILLETARGSLFSSGQEYISRKGTPRLFESEKVVVDAVFGAIFSLRDTVLVTKNKCVFEQVFALLQTLHCHYRTWQFCKQNKELIDRKLNAAPPSKESLGVLIKIDRTEALGHSAQEQICQKFSCYFLAPTSSKCLYVLPLAANLPSPMVNVLAKKVEGNWTSNPSYPKHFVQVQVDESQTSYQVLFTEPRELEKNSVEIGEMSIANWLSVDKFSYWDLVGAELGVQPDTPWMLEEKNKPRKRKSRQTRKAKSRTQT